jgi:polyisoprenoid-binding protein YceI
MSTDTLTHPPDTQSIPLEHWRIDPTRSSVEFHAQTLWGLATVKGRFERYEGTLDLQQNPVIELTIDAASLTTNLGFRDRHLRSADFFDAVNHPQVSFVSDNATLERERVHVRGCLHAAGQSIPLELDARLRRVGDELEVDARTKADHRQLGMSHGLLGMIPTPSQLIVHGRLVR